MCLFNNESTYKYLISYKWYIVGKKLTVVNFNEKNRDLQYQLFR